MPRPRKFRKVCHFPENLHFQPENPQGDPVILTVDEYETIRLIDLEGLSQEECSAFMGIARTTVQLIYGEARRKIAAMMVEGRPLQIRGGDFRICGGEDSTCSRGCYKRHYHELLEKPKGVHVMRIAVTYENGTIFQHFGHTAQFKIYDVVDGAVGASAVVDTMGSGHGALAGFLAAHKVDTLICGGIGGGAQMALGEAGIKIYGGVSGNADEAVAALLAGALDYNPNVRCSHHDHEHGEGGHTCGSSGCGSHSCGNH